MYATHCETADRAAPVWRFPFVQIGIDPTDPAGVAIRVADELRGHEYVDLNVAWDD